jgi:uncharacterized protein (DUF1330 family)
METALGAYLIANVKVHDDAWIPEYVQKLHESVHKHGGKHPMRSGSRLHFLCD